MKETIPGTEQLQDGVAPHLVITPYVKDDETGVLYVHRDYEGKGLPYEDEAHISPPNSNEAFGDVEAWAAFITRFSAPERALLTWNAHGLKAVLDYHKSLDTPGRCQWLATMPFVLSPEYKVWSSFANGTAFRQKDFVEKLEDLADHIKKPDATKLMNILRNLRANATAKADTELNADGTFKVSFTKETSVKSPSSSGEIDLPSEIEIDIPVLKGHVEDGKPVHYRFRARLRVSVDGDAHLSLRLTLQNTEAILEDVYTERVQKAQELLGNQFSILRAG